MTDYEIQALLDDFEYLSEDEHYLWMRDACKVINTLRERLKQAQSQSLTYQEAYEAACEREAYWRGVAADNAARANDVRGQW